MYTNQSKFGESEQQPDDSLAEIIREQDAEEAELRKLIEEQRRQQTAAAEKRREELL